MKKDEDIRLGRRIKQIRSQLGMNQKDFAFSIEATVQALSNWENGRNKPNTVALHNIVSFYNEKIKSFTTDSHILTVDELLYGPKKEYIQNIIINSGKFEDKDLGLSPSLFAHIYTDKYNHYPSEKVIIDDYKEYLIGEKENYLKSRYDIDKIKKILVPMLLDEFDEIAFEYLMNGLYNVHSVNFTFTEIYNMYANNVEVLNSSNGVLIKDKQSLMEYLKNRINILEKSIEFADSIGVKNDFILEIADNEKYLEKIENEF